MNVKQLRTVGLALVTLLGAAHLRTAEAAPVQDACDDFAAGFAEGFCGGMGHDDWGSITYSCTANTITIHEVECVDEVQ